MQTTQLLSYVTYKAMEQRARLSDSDVHQCDYN